jgi:hypothetical protein
VPCAAVCLATLVIFSLKFLLICSVWTSYKVVAIEGFVPQSYRILYCVFGSLSVVFSLIVVGFRASHALWLRRSLQKVASSDEQQSGSELIAQLTWGATLGFLGLTVGMSDQVSVRTRLCAVRVGCTLQS